jgi:hypothetical protein
VDWQTTGSGRRLSVTVPPNASAQCVFPGATASQVTEGGDAVDRVPAVTVVGTAPGSVTLAVGSGRYLFAVETD